MLDSITRYIAGVPDGTIRENFRKIITPIADRLSSCALTSAGLVINAGAALIAKTGASAFYAIVQGKLVTIAGGTAMPALTGVVIPATNFGIVCFFVDTGGTVTMVAGTPGATLGAAQWPQFPVGKALIGALVITHSSTFTGGTTALDTATTVYLSPVGPIEPTVLV